MRNGSGVLKVAYFSPLPPALSGVADYSALLIPALAERVELEVVPPGDSDAPRAADVCLYHIGNDPDAHGWILEALRRRPGVVVLHEFVLHHLVAGVTLGRGDAEGYLGAMQREAGVAGRLLAHGVVDGLVAPPWEVCPEDYPLADGVLDHASASTGGLVAHSSYVARRVRAAGYEGRLWTIPHPGWSAAHVRPASLAGSPRFGCFGNLGAAKRVPELLRAFARVRRSFPSATLHLVGAPARDLQPLVAGLPQEGVVWHGRVDEERLWSVIAGCDVCVSLRGPTMGETSGIAIRALSLGRPLVVSDVGWFAELPDDVALKVSLDADEVETLAAALALLAANDKGRRAMGEAAVRHARREHDLDHVADAYVAALEGAAAACPADALGRARPAPRGARRHSLRRRALVTEAGIGG